MLNQLLIESRTLKINSLTHSLGRVSSRGTSRFPLYPVGSLRPCLTRSEGEIQQTLFEPVWGPRTTAGPSPRGGERAFWMNIAWSNALWAGDSGLKQRTCPKSEWCLLSMWRRIEGRPVWRKISALVIQSSPVDIEEPTLTSHVEGLE